jgi:hypothetical protein
LIGENVYVVLTEDYGDGYGDLLTTDFGDPLNRLLSQQLLFFWADLYGGGYYKLGKEAVPLKTMLERKVR